jgi:hypothetical protein
MGVFHMSDENMLPMSLLLDSVLAGAGAGSGAFAGAAAGLLQLKPPKAGAAGACSTVTWQYARSAERAPAQDTRLGAQALDAFCLWDTAP